MGHILTGDQQKTANRRIGEILRQFGQDEYPYDPEAALAALQAFGEGRFEAVGAAIQPVLRLISGGETLVLDATDGAETILTSKGVFAFIEPGFNKLGVDEASDPMPATPVAVYELERDATFAQMFGGNPGALCLTQSQILNFIRKYWNWLPTDTHTFFLFRSSVELFVARVRFGECVEFMAGIDRFGYVPFWGADSRLHIVLPQL